MIMKLTAFGNNQIPQQYSLISNIKASLPTRLAFYVTKETVFLINGKKTVSLWLDRMELMVEI